MNSEEDRPDLRSRGRIYVVDRHDDDYIQRDLGGGVLVASGGGSRMGGAGAAAVAGHGWVRGAAKVGWKRWRRNLITRVADPATHFKYMENIWISITSDTTRNEDFNARKRGRPDKKCWSLMVFSCMEYMGRNHVRHTIK